MEENLQNEETQDSLNSGEFCNGAPMPPEPKGKVGEWVCTPEGWVWTDFIG